MRLHRQSASRLKFSEQGNLLGVFSRLSHDAATMKCPRCEANPTTPCRVNGEMLPALVVHIERMEEYL